MRGTAVIASRSGGLAEMVQDGLTGVLVPPGDVHALSAALTHILKDKSLAEQMGNAGRSFALEHFNMETYLDRLLALYQKIADGQ